MPDEAMSTNLAHQKASREELVTAIASTLPRSQLLFTKTGGPLQPIRLYYGVPSKAAVTRVLTRLRCMAETSSGAWIWHYDEEAAALRFACPREYLPPEVFPVVLGGFRFPAKDQAVLEVRSSERAIAAAKFFGPRFGPKVVLRRLRVLNRFLQGSEDARGVDRIDALLDENVVRTDPAQAQAARDVPLVEDLPLAPEDESDEFRRLTTTLQFRSLRCFEHWRGNTHLTLADVIRMHGRREERPRSEHPTSPRS
jgi:hypothetical protein